MGKLGMCEPSPSRLYFLGNALFYACQSLWFTKSSSQRSIVQLLYLAWNATHCRLEFLYIVLKSFVTSVLDIVNVTFFFCSLSVWESHLGICVRKLRHQLYMLESFCSQCMCVSALWKSVAFAIAVEISEECVAIYKECVSVCACELSINLFSTKSRGPILYELHTSAKYVELT